MTDSAFEPVPTTTGFVEVEGGRLYYETTGTGTPLVLLHAGIADASMWDEQWDVFAAHHRVLRYDLRGYWRSPADATAFAAHADLHALLTALDIQRAHIVGASYGGKVAIDFALTWPEMVDGLVLVCPALGGYTMSDALDASEAEIETAFFAGDFDRAAEIDIHNWLDGPRRDPTDIDPAVRDRALTMARRVYVVGATNGEPGEPIRIEPAAIERLEQVFAPTLLIVGEEDQPDMQAIAAVLEQRVGETERHNLPATAHLPNLEQPTRFNRLVLDFLGRLDRSAIELRAITADNWAACVQLSVAQDQGKLIEANAISIAESHYHPWMLPLALYHGEDMVGFTMFSTYPDPREGHCWVHRLMIDQRYQGRGYGRAGIRAVVQDMAALPDCDEIWIGYDQRNDAARRVYASVGFRETGPAPWEGNDVAAVRRLHRAVDAAINQ